MKPSLYKESLHFLALRDQLSPSSMLPALATEIMAMERALGAELPPQYEEFLTEAGTGTEHGGLAVWYHVDLMLPGNIIAVSRALVNQAHKRLGQFRDKMPKDILVISDRCDGTYLCLRKSGRKYLPTVWLWDSEELLFEMFAPDLEEALSLISECDEDELAMIGDKPWVKPEAGSLGS